MSHMNQFSASTYAVAAPPAGRYQIDPERSAVTFRTRHMFGLGPVRGTLALRDGVIEVADPVTASTAWARVAAATFRTGNDARDATVLSPRLLDAQAHPSISFASTVLVQQDGSWLLEGELEVRGTTRPVEAHIGAVSSDGATLRATARLNIDRYAFGVTAYRGLAARHLVIDLDIIAGRVPAIKRVA